VEAKYYIPEENLFIISSRGNEKIREAYLKTMDASKYGITVTILSGFKFEPIYDKVNPSLVIGTRMIMISTADHGSIPKWILEKFAPKAMIEFLDEFSSAARKV
jgi:hypothetical protein